MIKCNLGGVEMKKLVIPILAVLLIGSISVPAMALDHEFGGFWRTRFWNNTNFSGNDDGSQDVQLVDTRTQIYYTAIFSDEFKLVNKFEMDAVWGDDERGAIGADAVNLEIKNSYADLTLGSWNAKIGTQDKVWSRGLLFDDDFSGAIVRYTGDTMLIPFIWIKAHEGGFGKDANDMDVDYYGLDPRFYMGDLKLNPFVLYVTSNGGGTVDDDNEWTGWPNTTGWDDFSLYYLGANVDYATDMFSAWFTGIFMGGSMNVAEVSVPGFPNYYQSDAAFGTDSVDFSAYLFAAGGSMDFDPVSVHAEVIYASGDDNGYEDDEVGAFWVPAGQSYYWAEIMGMGLFDNQPSAGSPGSRPSNLMAYNLGVAYPMDRLTLGLDIWHASLVEENEDGETELGTEIDVSAQYQLTDDLVIKAVAAYLAAGEATGGGDESPFEVGVQLSVKF